MGNFVSGGLGVRYLGFVGTCICEHRYPNKSHSVSPRTQNRINNASLFYIINVTLRYEC